MSDDEIAVNVISCIASLVLWSRWYNAVFVPSMPSSNSKRFAVYYMPLASLAILFAILKMWSSHDVRDSGAYLWFYMCMGAAWLGLCTLLFPWMGISARDDVVERRNAAAGFAVGGALIGCMLAFAGSNIGDGPGWWVVVFCALISGGSWFLCWFLMDQFTGVSEAITVERDEAAGVRLGGFLVAVGLVVGRAVAGNWISQDATVRDFAATAWPAIPLLCIAAVVEKVLSPVRVGCGDNLPLGSGVLVALLYIGAAAAYVYLRGPW